MKKIIKKSKGKVIYIADKAWGLHKMEPMLFPVLLALYFALSSLGELVDDLMEGDHEFDNAVLAMLRPENQENPLGPAWLREIMRDFSALGGVAVLTFLTLVAALYLFVLKKKFKAWFLLGAVGTGAILTNILKAGFDRPRPDLMPLDSFTFTASFPSGHSMMAAVVYLTLGCLLAENAAKTRLKVFILSVAIAMAILVGISRVYLGAHWASDVMAGWLAGAAWALLFWLGERYLLYRQKSSLNQ